MTRLQQALLAAVAVVVLIGVSLHYVIVNVDQRDPDGTRFWLPVPIELAQVAIWLIPDFDERVKVDTKEIEQYRPVLEALLDGLQDVEDVDLVQVENGDETVIIRKAGARFEINVQSSNEEVQVKVSTKTLRSLADSLEDGRFDIAAALSALKHSPGPLVRVSEPSNKLTLAVW